MTQSDGRLITQTFPSFPSKQANNVQVRIVDLPLPHISLPVDGDAEPIPPVRRKSKRDLAAEERAKRQADVYSLDGLSEEEYCETMRARGWTTSPAWQKWGCPPDYLDAWNLTKKTLRNRFLRVVRHSERKNARRRTGKK